MIAEPSDKTPRLTPLQQQISILVMNGLTNREIADRLAVTPGTVGREIGRIVLKHGLTRRSQLQPE
jgi:DNA-binding CsgD family transcriptional regulator